MPRTAKIAALDDVADFAAQIPDEYLQCRITRRHIPDPSSPYHVAKWDRKKKEYDEQGPCIICGLPVHIVWSDDGDVVRSGPDYTDHPDYLMPKGTGRLDRNGYKLLRREMIRRRRAALRTVRVVS